MSYVRCTMDYGLWMGIVGEVQCAAPDPGEITPPQPPTQVPYFHMHLCTHPVGVEWAPSGFTTLSPRLCNHHAEDIITTSAHS